MFAGALASVLLGFAVLLALPQTAHAQVEKDVWSGGLDVAATSTSTTLFGYKFTDYGTLTPRGPLPLLSSQTKERRVFEISNDNASGGTLTFSVDDEGINFTDPLSIAGFPARLTLHIGLDSFDGADATSSVAEQGESALTWSSSGLSWAAGQFKLVKLSLSVPGVNSIAFSSAGVDNTFETGDAVTATVTFSEAVTVDTTGGTPQLTINVGGTDKALSYSSGSGTTALVFSGYTVAAGHQDANGLAVAADKLDLNGGTIKATADANPDADLDHDAVADSASHKVDGGTATNASVNSIAFNSAGVDNTFAIADAVTATVTFSASVDVDTTGGTPQLEIDVGGTPKALDYSSGSGSTSLVFTGYTVAANDVDANGLSIAANKLTLNSGTITITGSTTNAVLTHAAVANSASHKVDGVKPTLVITGADAPKTSTDGTKVILTFSENISLTFGTTFVTAYTVTIGGTAATVDSVEVTPGNLARIELMLASTNTVAGGDTVTVALASDAVLDGAGNGNDALAATAVTNAVPVVAAVISTIALTSNAGPDQTYGIGDAVEATVTFSEAVTVDATDGTPQLTIKVGSSDKTLSYASGSGTTALVFSGYTVAANDEDTDGLSVEANKLSANGGTIKKTADTSVDAVLTHAAVPASASHKVDGVKPTLVTTGSNAPKTSLDGSRIILFFSEPIGTVDRPEITVKSGGTAVTTTGSTTNANKVEITLTTALTTAETMVTVELAADAVKDVPGNGIAAVAATSVFRARAPGAPVLTVAAKHESIELSWTIADNGSSDITRFEYRIKETTGGTYPATWTNTGAAASNTGGSATIGSLTNTTQYTVQVRGVNSEGEGAVSNEPTATPDAPPAIDSVAITSTPATANTYIIGEDIVVTVTFDKNIAFSGSGSDPYLALRVGTGDTKEVDCDSGTPPTKDLVCTYTVVENDEDGDGVSVPSGTITRSTYLIVGPLGQTAVLTHTGLAASANHKVDGVKPTLSSANASGDLTKVVLTFSEAIGTVDNTKITVKKGGTDQTTMGAAIDSANSTKVEITLTTALLSSDTNITVELAADAVTDMPGNGIDAVSSMAVSLVDTTAPTLDGASTYTVGGSTGISLDFSETIDGTSIPAASAFTVEINDEDVVESSVSRSTTNTDVINVVLGSNPRPGDSVTIEYAKPSLNPLKDAADNEVASFSPVVVDNTLAATAPEAPRSLAAGTYNISTAPVRVAADILELSWIIPWHNGSPIEKFQYRYATGSSVPPSTTWVDIPNSTPGHPNDTDFDVTGLDADTEYTFEVQAVNGIGASTASSVTRRTLAPAWSFTLRDSSNANVTELTEGGDSATAEVSITNTVRFSTAQTVTLEWGDTEITSGLIQGAGGSATITIDANGNSGTLEISAPDPGGDAAYSFPVLRDLRALHEGTGIGLISLKFVDDEPLPVASITEAPAAVDEGDAFDVEITLTPAFAASGGNVVEFSVTDDGGALSGPPQSVAVFSGGQTTETITFTTDDNTTQNDGAHDVTFALERFFQSQYNLAPTPAVTSVTITVRDDDTPPLAPRNLTAQAGDTEATLSWDAPAASTPDHGQPVLRYEYRVKTTGLFGSWAPIPGGDADTRSHTFTGLTNDQEHTYQVRAVNVAGGGASLEKSVTPIVGIAVSFGAATLSVDEGDQATVTVTLALAPAVGETVTVPLTATPGTGLDSTEYSGVPMNVTFGAGDISKSFTVTAVDDTDDEPDRLLTLAFGALPEGYVPGANSQLELTLVDNDVPIVSASFGAAAESVAEGIPFDVTVSLSQAPEREVALPIRVARGANLAADEVEGVPSSLTFAADETEKSFAVTFADDAVVEGNETLTLTFGTFADSRVTLGANPQLVVRVTDDDGPPAAVTDLTALAGDGFVTLSWAPVANDSPILRYEVRVDGGAWQSVGLDTSYRYGDLENGRAYAFEVRAVNAHGDGDEASSPGTPTARLTGIPNAVQVLQVKATDSGRAELSWTRPANGTDRVTANSATATFSQIQGYRIEVCRTVCDDEANWYALVPNTRKFEHKYVHQVLAPGVIRENHYRVQAININGKPGPWSNVATLDETVVESFWLQTPDDSTLWVRFKVRNPDGNLLYVRYENTGTGAVAYTDYRLTKKGDVKLDLTGLAAGSWYRVDIDFSPDFDSARKQSRWYGTARAGHTPLKSPYRVDALDAQVFEGGVWRDAPDNALRVRMGETGKYRVRLKPCGGIHDVIVRRIQAPAGRLRASPMDTDPVLFTNLNCESEFDDWRRDEHGNRLTMDQVYDMTNFPDRAKDFIPIYAGTPNNWKEVTVTARALEDYPADRRHDALLSAPFAVVYNHEVWKEVSTTQSALVSEGTGLVRVSVDRPADATLPEPSRVTIARAAGASGGPVMSWDAVPGATGYKVEWRHGVQYSTRANQNRSLVTATSVTLPLGGSGRGPITARVRAYSSSGVSGWVERSWDTRAPTLNVLDTAVNEADGSVGFLVTLSPAASGTVTVDYATVDNTAVAGTDYTATSGTLTFAPGETRKSTALVPIADDGEEDSGETFRLVLSNPSGSDANNGAAVLGDAEAVGTILNSEQEPGELTSFTLVDAGTNGDLMVLADGSTVTLGTLLAPSYGIRAEMGPGAAPGSVRLALSGAKTVTYTDDAAPYSLYGDGAGRVNGEALPPGSYTLTATAYADSGGRGEERGSLEVAFTVMAGALGVTTPGPFTVAEGTTAVAELAASDTGTGDAVSWSIPAGADGGADGAAFTLNSDGVLALRAAKDFEAPDDAGGDGTWAVTVRVRAGAQSATAALLVTLTDANEAPVAKATAAPSVVREGAAVTLDGNASTDPDAGDTLSYAWTQTDEGGPRVTLSDASAAKPVFTAPSDLAAETELAFTLRATDAGGLYTEDTVTVTVSLISEVAIAAATDYAAEGADAVFRLTRAGSARAALTVPVTVEESGAMLGTPVPENATFAAGARATEFRVPTAADAVQETDSRVTARLASGAGWQLAPGAVSASLTVLDDDVAPVDVAAAADVTVWSAEMTVVEYGPRAIGAGSADLFSNQMGRAGLRAKWLWYDPAARKLKLGFDDGLDDAEALTLHVGGVSLGFPDNTGGNSSFTLENVDVAWTDGETVAARVSKPSVSAVSTDATLASLAVEGAVLSPAFDAGVLVYRAAADAETVTVTASANDGGAAVTYGPAADADPELADHQVAVPEGETLVAVTVTAADGTVRRYRVVVARAADGANTAPAGLPAISGTAQVGEELSASADDIVDADGLENATYAWQWLSNDGTEGAGDTAIAAATAATYTPTPADVGKTLKVRVTFADGGGTQETLVSEATVAVAATVPSAPAGLAVATAEGRERELTVSWTAPDSNGGSEVTGYTVQWKSGTEAWDGSQTSTRQAVQSDPAATGHTITGLVNGTAYTVRVLAVNAAGDGAAAEAGATVQDRVAPTLVGATVDGTVLTLTYSEALKQDSAPAAGAFAVTVAETARTVDGVAVSESAAVLTLASGVVSGETVTVDYTPPTGATATPLRDAAGNAAAGLSAQAVTNETGASNTAPAGLPAISGTAEVGEELTASADDIVDADGLENVTFTWKWLANNGTADSEIAGATNAAYEVAPEQAGKTVKVRVTFTDDKGNEETLVSEATDAVVDKRPVAATLAVGDGAAEAGRFRLRIAFADAVTGLAAADVSAARVGGDAAAVSDLVEAETGRVWTAWVAAAEAGRFTVRLAAGAAQSGARRSLAAMLAVDVDAAGNATAVAGPVVTSLALATAPGGSWTDGDAVRLTLTFSEPVTVATDGGTPSVGIGLDGTARQVAYAGGTGTASLAFSYTVTADDGTVSAVSVTADSLALNGGTIRDAAGRDADLEHPGIGDAATEDAETESASALTGLTLVDAGSGVEVSLADGDALVLDDPANGSYGIVAAVAADAGVGSVRLGLTGAKTVTVTDDAAPYSLYGDEDGTVTGAALPAGSYTLMATAYAEAAGGGAELGTLEVSFRVTAGEAPDALTASFADVPASHNGSARFTFTLTFSEAPHVSYAVLRDDAFTVSGGKVKTAVRREPGSNVGWDITVEPDGDGDVTIALAATSDCNASDAICTSGGLALTGVPAALTVPGPDADDGNGVATAGALTASFGGMPDAHEGPGELFTFQLTFSEAPDVGYVTLRDHAFAVSGGKVETAVRREQGSNLGWTITVEPDGWGDVRIALPGSRPCTSTHAICTSDDRRLSSLLDATVQGPVGLSVADASVQEGSGATLDFAVTLSRAATATVTVDYATSNGTATAGADYTATSGKLTFDPGETEQTVNVTVLDDVHDDGGETLTLTLSNATGARIADATATGTIENSDPIPAAWLARFGRTVADHVVDAIGERLTGSPGGGSQVTLGGQRIPLDGVPGGAGNDTSSGGTDGSDARETAAAADTLAAFADRMSNDGAGTAWVNWGGFGGEDAAKRPASRSLSERELLLGSSFQLSLGGGDANGTGTAWTAWGRAASSSFDGEADDLSLDGDVTTFTLGADAVRGRWLGGVALAHSTGEGGFRDHADTDHPDRGSGELESTLTSVHPYLRLQASERLSLWGILGYGTGDLTLAVDAAGDRPRQTWKTGTEMWMAATGARGVLLSAADHDGFELAARGDARLARMNSDAATGADGAGKLAATESQTSRLRFILEGSHRIELAGEQTLTPSLEVGLRQDGGDAETGTGVELGGGVSYADPALGLTVTAKARGLLAHEDADYTEWGASGSVKIDPGASGRGLSLSLSPAWGAESGGAERLWGLRDARGLAGNENFEPAGRLDSEAGWGFGAFGGRGVMTPFAGLSLSDAGERTWRSGVRWTLGPDTAFGVEGTLREAANDNEAEHGARFKFIARW